METHACLLRSECITCISVTVCSKKLSETSSIMGMETWEWVYGNTWNGNGTTYLELGGAGGHQDYTQLVHDHKAPRRGYLMNIHDSLSESLTS